MSEPIVIDDELAAAINGAFDAGKPITVAYVDADGQPHLSFRGSTQAHGKDQLAIWVREPTGGLLAAIPQNPRMTLMYRDIDRKATYLFYGRAAIVTDKEVGGAIYDNSPEGERNRDPERGGVAIVIDLDRIQGGPADHRVDMRRNS